MAEEKKTRIRMNLAAIQKVDPYAKEILDSSSHVAYYTFKNKEWEKSDIEGAFFVYSRLAEPYHSIFINNRLHTTSLMEPVVPNIQLQEQAPFLLYRSQKNQIFGFWFYNKDDCKRIFNLLNNIIKKSNQPASKSDATRPVSKKEDVDIFSMLEQAQMNFISTPNQPPPQQQQQLQQIFQKAQPMQQVTNNIVQSFFAAAQKPLNNTNPPQVHDEIKQQQPIVNKNVCPTVDEIEKLHRQISISPKSPAQPMQQIPMINSNPKLQQLNDNKPKGPTLVTPNMLMKPKAPGPQQKPLDPQQLVQALQYLLENDAEFTRKIHETYIKNFASNSN